MNSLRTRRNATPRTPPGPTADSSPQFHVEALERRLLLAGTVRVIGSANTGNVTIRGDGNDNQIEIFSTDTNEIVLRGLNGTVVNQGAVDEFERILRDNDFSVFHRHLTINLGGGDDVVAVGGFAGTPQTQFGVAIQGNLRINTAAGEDLVRLGFMDVDGITRIATSAGSDRVTVAGPFARGRFDVITAAGNDIINIDQLITDSTSVINTGSGDDTVSVANGLIHETLAIRSGGGGDTINIGRLGLSGAPDEGPFFLGPLNVNTGAGNDTIDIFNVQMRAAIIINTASGDDRVNLHTGVFELPVTINTGSGADQADVGIEDDRGPTFQNTVNMIFGGGDDELRLHEAQFDAKLTATGGGGFRDCLSADPGVVFNATPMFSFDLNCDAIE